MLEPRLLRYFLAVADQGSVTKAAAIVRVAQPSISRQIRQLEEVLGAPLFDRQGGRMHLSAAGQAFLPLARDLIRRTEVATDFLRGMASPTTVSLSLVAPETTVADVIAPFLAERGGGGPAVTVRESMPSQIFAEVISGAADIGISSGPPPGALSSRPIIRFAILAYVKPDDPLARHRSVSLAELARHPLITLSVGHGTRRTFDDAIAQAGLKYTAEAVTDVPHVAQAMAAAGRGVAIVTDDRRYGLRPLFIETPTGRLTITLFAAWNGGHYAEALVEALIEDLALYAARRYGHLERHPGEQDGDGRDGRDGRGGRGGRGDGVSALKSRTTRQ